MKNADRQSESTFVPIREELRFRDQPLQTETGTHRRLPGELCVRMAADKLRNTGGGPGDKTQANLMHCVSLMNADR